MSQEIGEQRGNFLTEGARPDANNIDYLDINERDMTDLERDNSDEDHQLIEQDTNGNSKGTNSKNHLSDQ